MEPIPRPLARPCLAEKNVSGGSRKSPKRETCQSAAAAPRAEHGTTLYLLGRQPETMASTGSPQSGNSRRVSPHSRRRNGRIIDTSAGGSTAILGWFCKTRKDRKCRAAGLLAKRCSRTSRPRRVGQHNARAPLGPCPAYGQDAGMESVGRDRIRRAGVGWRPRRRVNGRGSANWQHRHGRPGTRLDFGLLLPTRSLGILTEVPIRPRLSVAIHGFCAAESHYRGSDPGAVDLPSATGCSFLPKKCLGRLALKAKGDLRPGAERARRGVSGWAGSAHFRQGWTGSVWTKSNP